jgi:hypothetical protein
VEAGWNNPTLALRVVKDDEKGTRCLGVKLFLGDINKEPWPSGWGLEPGLTILLCERIIVAKSKEVKTGYSLAEYSEERYDSERLFCQ